jgi:hypothetical protein
MSIWRIGKMMQFTDKYPCTLTNRSTGVTVDVMRGITELCARYMTVRHLSTSVDGLDPEYVLTDIWLDVGGKQDSLKVEAAREYVLTLTDVTLLVMADACWEESSIFGSEPITLLHLYLDSYKKI